MKKRIMTVALIGASVFALGAMAIAAARSVSTTPPPAVIPQPAQVSDDPATHDLGDDNGVDDPATHDVGDDNGVDDPATHDLGDDNGGDDKGDDSGGDDSGGSGGGSDDGPSHT